MKTENNLFFELKKSAGSTERFLKVQGIATGTKVDRDGHKMALRVLNKFVDKINSEGMDVTNGHQKGGAIDDDLGKLVNAKIVHSNEGDLEVFVIGELDMDNPSVQYLKKQLEKGRPVGFSIEGLFPEWRETITKEGEQVTEVVDVSPKAISITTKPSYVPSYVEVLEKSYFTYKKNCDMEKNKKPEADKELLKAEEGMEGATLETPVEETSEENMDKYSKLEKSLNELMEKVSNLEKRIGGSDTIEKSVEGLENTLKSFHEDIEFLKKQPLQKKSKVIEKSFEDTKKPKIENMKDLISSLYNN